MGGRRCLGGLVGMAVVGGLLAWVLRAYWPLTSFPYTHDGVNHLARFANYAAALRASVGPPRWAPYLFSGYGLPVFNYNYPLANILAVPAVWLGINPEQILRAQVVVALTMGIVSVWQLLQRRFSRLACAGGVVLYIGSTYLINLLFFRGNIGEIWMYGLLPLVVWLWTVACRQRQTTWWLLVILAMIAWWLAHNVFTWTTLPLLLLWSGLYSRGARQTRWWFVVWLLSALAAVWFWGPALGELGLVAIAGDELAGSAWQHLLTWEQLWWSPPRFGFSLNGPIDTMGFGLGLPSVMVLIGSLAYGWSSWIHCRRSWPTGEKILWLYGLLVIGGALWLSSTSSRWLWEAVSPLNIMQFPWRWLLLPSLLLPWYWAWCWDRSRGGVKWLLAVPLLLAFLAIGALRPADRLHHESLFYRNFPESTLTRNENRPLTLSADDLGAWAPGPRVATGSAQVTAITQWSGLRHQYQIHVATAAVIIEPTVYFPGWQTMVDGKVVTMVFTPLTKGLIAYALPARAQPYLVRTIWAERTGWRILSDLISLVAIVIIAAMAGRQLWLVGRGQLRRRNHV